MVAAGYDRLAPIWDDWSATVTPPLFDEYLDWLDERLSPGAEVVELGCGTGRPVAERLAPQYRYTGFDVSSAMLATAGQRVPDGRFVHGDMTRLTLGEASVDAVVAFYSIIHVPRDQHADLFRKIASWLRPGGCFVASLHGRDEPDFVDPDWLDGGPMFWSGHEPAASERLLRDAGFDDVVVEPRTQWEGDVEVQFSWVTARRAA